MSQATSSIYQIKVTLRDSKPPIWRRFLVSGDTTLAHLHTILQVVMGWEDAHLHVFDIGEKRYSIPLEESPHQVSWMDDLSVGDSRSVRLTEVVTQEGQKLNYGYDFGDGWEHTLLIEKILPANLAQPLPYCLKGKRACPLEDVGGVWGYDDFLDAIKNDDHPEHEDMTEWMQETFGLETFDPEIFDLEAVNTALRALSRS